MTFQGNIDALPGREVYGTDGRKIGKVGQVFVLEDTDEPTWMTVHTGLFGSHESFVPVAEATERGDELHVPFDKSFVQDAPRIDDASDLTVEQEAELYRYYGVQPPLQQGSADALGQSGADRRDERGERDERDDRGARDDRDDRDSYAGRGAHAARDSDGESSRDERRDAGASAGDTDDRSAGTDGPGASGTGGTGANGAPRIRRRVVTEMQTIQVPVQREEIVVEDDGIDDGSDTDRHDRTPG